jgi:hypothetical protein
MQDQRLSLLITVRFFCMQQPLTIMQTFPGNGDIDPNAPALPTDWNSLCNAHKHNRYCEEVPSRWCNVIDRRAEIKNLPHASSTTCPIIGFRLLDARGPKWPSCTTVSDQGSGESCRAHFRGRCIVSRDWALSNRPWLQNRRSIQKNYFCLLLNWSFTASSTYI